MAFRMIETSCTSETVVPLTATRYPIRQLTIYFLAANEDIYMGDANVSILNYAHKFSNGTAETLTIGPFGNDAPVNTNEIYFWTAGDDPSLHSILITP